MTYRTISVSCELADALEAGGYTEQSFVAASAETQALIGGGGLVQLIRLLPELTKLFGSGGLLRLVQTIPALLAAVQAGNWAEVIRLIGVLFPPSAP